METITELNHINIRTNKMEETKNFYVEVIGLKVGFRPLFRDHGYWLYAGETAIVHLSPAETGSDPRTNPEGMGDGLDHIGLSGKGLKAYEAHLKRLGVDYTGQIAAGGRLVQLFINDPNGVRVEIAYNTAAEGVKAGDYADAMV
jgi:catechol 2,3-dioxygenase-like lactoylglutathione lyase family enzyme